MNPHFTFVYKNATFESQPDKSVMAVDNCLTVTLQAKRHDDFNAVEWVLWFENTGNANSGIISDVWDCDVVVPVNAPPKQKFGFMPPAGTKCVTVMNGVDPRWYHGYFAESAREFAFRDDYLPTDYPRLYKNEGGRSSKTIMPFFNAKGIDGGAMVAVGWTGDWQAEFTAVDGGIRVRTGLQHARLYLKPGEKIRTSSILVMQYTANEDSSNKFRRLLRAHCSHLACTAARREGLFAFELWGGLPSQEMIRRCRELKQRKLNFQDLWIDAGWYGQCTKCDDPFTGDWSKFTGEWDVNKRVHPNGLEDVRDAAAENGMNIMLWVEIERCIAGLPMAQEHPEWFLTNSNSPSQRILNLGEQEPRQYAIKTIADYVKKLNLGCYRQDFNVDLTAFFKEHDEPDRDGITEIKYFMGLYAFWDNLLDAFPGIIIDNCSSGGHRIDFETIKRSIPFFRSDYQCGFDADPDVVQTHNSNISRYLPFNGCTNKLCDIYALRSSFTSSFGAAFYNAVFQTMDEEKFALTKKICDDFTRIWRFLSLDFYNHGADVYDKTSWAIWQYHDPVSQEGVILAFRREKSPFATASITLKGNVREKLTVTNLDDGSVANSEQTIAISLPNAHSSVILMYK